MQGGKTSMRHGFQEPREAGGGSAAMRIRLKPIEQQTIVVTGGTSGNGLATVEEAVSRGAR